ncbi:MAG: segregation/condensation protein A [Candidatus Omnitrophica bacterium]|nr:segregation/condensation protein A [Candidatus Omnitrophota bacterium]
MTYKVKLPVFEGPLDLLLYLIRKDELDIKDIPISTITEQYLEYLELMKMLNLDIAGEFIVMAATLIHIKSKMLLPPSEEEGQEEEDDPRGELIKRLLEYKKFKEAAASLAQMEGGQRDFFSRGSSKLPDTSDEEGPPPFEASIFDLITAFTKVLNDVSKEEFYQVAKDEFTVGEKIHEIFHLLVDQPKILFMDLFRRAKSKLEIVTIFLALLELIRLKEIFVIQREPFSDIEIIRNLESSKVRSSNDG